MMTLYDLDKYVHLQRTHRRRKASAPPPPAGNGSLAPAPKNGVKADAVAKALARSRAFGTPPRTRVAAFTRPVDYTVPGTFTELRQPSNMTCWATVYAMLVAWRDQRSRPIADVLADVAKKWADKFAANGGTTAEEEAEFWAATNLVAQPLASHTVESWESLLREFGPLWIMVDVDPSDARAIHALMMTGIHGDGSPDGTTVDISDPASGTRRPMKLSEFLGKYHQGATRRTKSKRFNQIIHWPKDVKFAGARSLSARAFTGKPTSPPKVAPAPATTQPWSHYFQFRKGSKFEVDGPLSYNGSGEVLERTADYLKFTMNMPAVSIFGQQIPKADMVLEATFKKEGKGNLVRATINGVVMEDADAEIVSNGTKRTIRPNFSGFSGPLPEWITVTPDGNNEIDLDMKIDGRDVDFDLNLTSGSSGLALGIEPWSRSFPFPAGTRYEVDGPGTYNGTGRVEDRTDTHLNFVVNMKAGMGAPDMDLVVDLTYAREGSGNKLALTVNGTTSKDDNASITTDTKTNRRTIVHAIRFSGAALGKISFAPKSKDAIDLRVDVDNTERQFDLNRMSEAQSWVRDLAVSSTPASGLAEVTAFAGRTGGTRWKLSRANVASRLTQIINNPDVIDQGALNLCGPAAFFHAYAKRDPRGFARYAADLFEKGSGTLGTLKVTPDDDLVTRDYSKVVPQMGASVTPEAEWMCLGALRGSENAVLDFEGGPDENVAGITTPGELADWMKKSNVYNRVKDEGNWVSTKGIAHALALAPGANRDIMLLINAKIISAPAGKKKLIDAFPNHFIQLLSPVTRTAAGIEFDYWTWGLPPQRAQVNPSVFADNYYGAVTGEL